MKDQEVFKLLDAEEQRQENCLELIPSENYVSSGVRTALASVLTNKYSEGYPGKRYYGGQENTDQLEELAVSRAKALFRSSHANVQSHSGAQANEAVYHAWLEPGDTVLAMDLSHGGHLTHGHPVTVLAKQYNFIRYGMKDVETGEFDYEAIRKLAHAHRPKMILVGHSSFPRSIDYSAFAEIGHEIGAVLVADMAHLAGLIAGKVMPNPLDAGFHVMTATTHKTLRGPRGGLILSKGKVTNYLQKPEHTTENLPTLIDRAVFPGIQGGPHMNVIAAKAIAFHEALQPEFHDYAEQVLKNAHALADGLMTRGVKLVTNGTDNHLMVINLKASGFGLDGKQAEELLDQAGLNANKNVIPDDPEPPFRPSGLRLGTPAVTTRGMAESEMDIIAESIVHVLVDKSPETIKRVKDRITTLARRFPLPAE